MRLIDADALIESIKHGLWDWETVNGIESRTVLEQTIQDIRNEPTIDAEPVRHGKWIEMSDADGHYYACSECGEELHREWSFDRKYVLCFPKKITIDKTQFCSHCGAKMDEEDEQ